MATVIVVVLAGGAVALISKNKTAKAGELTKLVPAGAYGYIQVDLRQESSAGLFGYLSHFPGSPATKPDAKKATFRDTLLGSVFSKADNVDYGRDIQPWLGNEAGVAVFRGSNGNPNPLVVVAATDAAKAKESWPSLNATDKSFAYAVVGSDVLLAQHQSRPDRGAGPGQRRCAALGRQLRRRRRHAAQGQPRHHVGRPRPHHRRRQVGDRQDLRRRRLPAAVVAARSTCSATPVPSAASAARAFKGGRVVLGVSVEDKVATMTVRALGHKASTGSVVGNQITSLPADTTGAIAFGDVSGGITSAMKSLSSLSGLARRSRRACRLERRLRPPLRRRWSPPAPHQACACRRSPGSGDPVGDARFAQGQPGLRIRLPVRLPNAGRRRAASGGTRLSTELGSTRPS